MDSDSVNSISDTIEATSVAEVVRQVYFDLVDEMDLPANDKLVALTGLGDTTKPTHMLIPQDVSEIRWIKYDKRTDTSGNKAYAPITYMEPQAFVTMINGRPSTDTTNYLVVPYDANVSLIIDKKHGPSYWTTFDDEYIVFDSYDSSVDSTLQSSKTIVSANYRPTFTLTDTFTPDLPENLFGLLYTQALARCFANQKQQVNPKIERQESRMRVRSQRNMWRTNRHLRDTTSYAR